MTQEQESEKREYFDAAQKTERYYFKELFKNFFKPNNCHSLTLSSTDDDPDYPTHYDGHFFSAITKSIFFEFKKRNVVKSSDAMIEFTKFKALYDYYRTGHIVLFIIEFNDIIAIWNLSKIYEAETGLDLDQYFYMQDCTKSMFNYTKGQEENYIRDLMFSQCDYILDTETYKVMTHKEYIDRKVMMANRPKPIPKKDYSFSNSTSIRIRELERQANLLHQKNVEDVNHLNKIGNSMIRNGG
jgi:hypothetical protein